MLGQPTDEPLSAQQRFHYIKIAKDMTRPLLAAYHSILDINTRRPRTNPTKHPQEDLPLYDHLPTDTHTELHITDPDHPEYTDALASHVEEVEAMFVQEDTTSHTSLLHSGPNLHRASDTIRWTEFDICDAANTILPNCYDSDTTTPTLGVDGPF